MAITRIGNPAIADQRGVNFRNIIINGGMDVAQRGTSTTGLQNSPEYLVDRWSYRRAGTWTTATYTMTQETDVPSAQGFTNSTKIDVTASEASAPSDAASQFAQFFEGQMLQYLKKGTSNAQQLTLSFWVKSNKTGTYITECRDIDNSRSVSKSYTINSANTWEKKIITFPADTTGTLDNDNNNSFNVYWWLAAGTDFTSGTLQTSWGTTVNANIAVGQVNLADSTSNEWYITGVQLEAGQAASDFEFLPYDVNKNRCLRYYEETDPDARLSLGGYIKQDNTKGRIFWTWKVEKRSAPTLSVEQDTAGNAFTLQYGDSGSRNCSNTQITMSQSSIDCCQVDVDISETMLSGYGLTAHVRGDLSNNTRLVADAEL